MLLVLSAWHRPWCLLIMTEPTVAVVARPTCSHPSTVASATLNTITAASKLGDVSALVLGDGADTVSTRPVALPATGSKFVVTSGCLQHGQGYWCFQGVPEQCTPLQGPCCWYVPRNTQCCCGELTMNSQSRSCLSSRLCRAKMGTHTSLAPLPPLAR